MQSALTVEGVNVDYGDSRVLRQIDLTVKKSEFVALLGASGCGKTTLLRAIAGFVPVAQARVFSLGLNGTVLGVVLVHAAHGLVYAVWIAAAAFAAVEEDAVLAARNMGAGALTAFRTVTLPLAAPGIAASAIFVFLESLDEFTASFFVGAPDVRTLPLLLYSAAAGGNMRIAAITALILLVPSIIFMAVVQRFLRADVLAGVGK
jgi:putative spermidine/putrescine transport system permease protein